MTKGKWNDQNKNITEEILEAQLEDYLKSYPVLEEIGYEHTREQIYLMLKWNMNKDTIRMLLDSGASSMDIDLLRNLSFLMGDEYVEKFFLNQEFAYEEAIHMVKRDLMLSEVSELKEELIKLEQERKKLEKDYEMDMNFLKYKYDAEKRIHDQELEHAKEMYNVKEKNLREQLERAEASLAEMKEMKEKDSAGKISNIAVDIRSENIAEKMRGQNMDHPVVDSPLISRAIMRSHDHTGNDSNDSNEGFALVFTEGNEGGFFSRFSKKKDRKEKLNAFVQAVKDENYTDEQLGILEKVMLSDSTLTEFTQLLNPKLPLDRMQMLCRLFLQRQGIRSLTKGGEDHE